MDIFEAILLGIIQGLTEWLPISSSGHLVLAKEWMGFGMSMAYGVMLHFATALVIIIMFRKDVSEIIKAVMKPNISTNNPKLTTKNQGSQMGPNKPLSEQNYWTSVRNDPYAFLGWCIIIGSVPIAVMGIVFYKTFEVFFSSAIIVGIALIGTGFVLTLSAAAIQSSRKKKLTTLDAYTIGVGQGLALVPGISRSGVTIGLGLMRNIERETVAKFSILLAVPAIIGAAIWELPLALQQGMGDIQPLVLVVGGITAFIVGFFAIKLLLYIVRKAGFHYFAVYCFGLGIIIVAMA